MFPLKSKPNKLVTKLKKLESKKMFLLEVKSNLPTTTIVKVNMIQCPFKEKNNVRKIGLEKSIHG